jgi:hypothetical protein
VAVPEALAPDHDDRVADLAPGLLEVADALVAEVEEVHDLVAQLGDVDPTVGRGPVGHGRELITDRPVDLGRVGQRPAVDDVQGRVEQQEHAGATGVDDAGLLQHGEQVGRAGERIASRGAGGVEHLDQRAALGGASLCGLGRLAHDGEDRALDRAQHRLVRLGRSGPQGLGHGGPRGVALGLEHGGHAPQDLRQDHPRVAAGAHQRPVADRRARAHQVGGRAIDLGDHGVERAGHVRAGVAVGHGVHVEAVDRLLVGAHDIAERRDRVAEVVDPEAFERGHGRIVPSRCHTVRRRTPSLRAMAPIATIVGAAVQVTSVDRKTRW